MTKRPASPVKILIVDDNPLLQRALKDMLGLWGVGQITAVANGQEAKDALRREPFDLMVTDWVMEPVGGAQLIQWARQSPGCLRPNLPIIVLTANADLSTVRCAWDAGADSVLAKPVPAATLARRIDAVLNRRDPAARAASRPDARGDAQGNGGAGGVGNGSKGGFGSGTGEARQPGQPSPIQRPAAQPVFPSLRPTSAPAPLPPSPPSGMLPPPDAGAAAMRGGDPRRTRMLLALDKLEAAIERPDPIGSRLRHALSDLQIAAAGDSAASSIVASLSTCVTWVEPDIEGYGDALQAHAAALRWLAGADGSAQSMAVSLCLIRALRASVRTLAARGHSDISGWPDAGGANPSGPAGKSPFSGR
ncbi:response regulator [Azospirillum picis]|uniref:CheY-like chemotaxis protein n=1 Tax=Azospirillum picis TaxID=488438 RepID=A0ABU0MFM9_9PROT|nr:response regulator [Azospirillum picis]MBP2298695.1 CheY-like chemotaxis protein [Azospirillum picis]MDQ0532256.1 CheY-like chemotaxis protein [Azospirillum picis]